MRLKMAPDGFAQLANCSADCLSNPPRCICTELEALLVIVLLYTPGKPSHTLSNQVGKLKALVLVPEGYADNEPLVAGQHL